MEEFFQAIIPKIVMTVGVVLSFSYAPEACAEESSPEEIVKIIVNSPPKEEKTISGRYFSRGLQHAFDVVEAIEGCETEFDGDLITGDQGLDSKRLLRADIVFNTGLVADVRAHIKKIGEGATTETDIEFIFIFEEGHWKIDEIFQKLLPNEKFAAQFLNTIHTRLNVLARTECK